MEEKKKVSETRLNVYTVIILNNSENSSEECIRSVQQQKAFKENRIQIIEENFTTTRTLRCSLLVQAEGDYISFFMSDAFVYSNTFEKMDLLLSNSRKKVDVVKIEKYQDSNRKSFNSPGVIQNLWDDYKCRIDTLSGLVICNEKINLDEENQELFWENYIYQKIERTMNIGILDAGYWGNSEAKLSVRNTQNRILSHFEQFNQLFSLEERILVNDIDDSELKNTLQGIQDELIIDTIGMGNLSYVLWLLDKKYEEKLLINEQSENGVVQINNYNIAELSYLAVTLHFIDITEDTVKIEGNISAPEVLDEYSEFWIEHNGQKIRCELKDCGMDGFVGNAKYERKNVFSAEFKLEDTKNRFLFFNNIQGHFWKYGKINSERFAPVADIIPDQYYYKNGHVLHISGNVLYCEKVSEKERETYEKRYQESLSYLDTKAAAEAIVLRKKYFEQIEKKKRPIWLFIDRVDRADDNAEVLYRYMKQFDEIDSYFVIQEGTEDYRRLRGLGNIIPLNSDLHRLLVLKADYILSSQANGLIENPFRDESEYYRDLYHQAKIIFLQHGVTKDDQHITFNRFNTNFTAIITSSRREYQSFLEDNYFYEADNIWLTGMPRYDQLYNNDKKIILIMPSWRKDLMVQKWDELSKSMIWKIKDYFEDSEYIKRYKSLLNNIELRDVCQKNGYKIAFMPHALVEPYIEMFRGEESNLLIWDRNKLYREAFAEGSILITDYSSVAFDFAYLGKPVLYYQFDQESFFAKHTYRKGYFKYEKDGFGEVLYDEKELISTLTTYIETDCQMKRVYKERLNDFYEFRDKNACKRIYTKLLEEDR